MNINKILIAAIAIIVILQIITLMSLGNSKRLGGTTADDWNVGGNLAVTGTSALTGALTQTGAATFSSTLTQSGGAVTLATTTIIGPMVQGGNKLSTTTITAGTLTAANICNNSIVDFLSMREATTITLPATTTLHADCLKVDGDHKVILFQNEASTTATTANVTIAAGAGIKTMSDDTNGDVFAVKAAVELEFYRFSSATTTVIIRPFTDAD